MKTKKYLISQESLDYSLPDDIYNVVKNDLLTYPGTVKESKEDLNKIIVEKYNLYPTINYGDFVGYTMTGYRDKTAEIADLASLDRIRIEDARIKVRRIQNGIKRAAYTSSQPNKRKKLKKDLEDYLLNRYPNQSNDPEKSKKNINRDPRSLRKYTKRAYYFIAVELGYISIDKDIQLAENQLNRVIGYE